MRLLTKTQSNNNRIINVPELLRLALQYLITNREWLKENVIQIICLGQRTKGEIQSVNYYTMELIDYLLVSDSDIILEWLVFLKCSTNGCGTSNLCSKRYE